jgi:hypothetical protein
MTKASNGLARRSFLAAAVSAVPAAAIASAPLQAPANDRDVLDLAAEITELNARCDTLRPRIDTLVEQRNRATSICDTATFKQRYDAFYKTPAGVELEGLLDKMEELLGATDPLNERLFTIPAVTREGKLAKLRVLKDYIWNDDWKVCDGDADWHVYLTRKLLWEFVGAQGLTV